MELVVWVDHVVTADPVVTLDLVVKMDQFVVRVDNIVDLAIWVYHVVSSDPVQQSLEYLEGNSHIDHADDQDL